MPTKALADYIYRVWEDSIIPTLMAYIAIPNKSPHFDPDWQRNGYMKKAVELIADWCRAQPLAGLQVEVIELPGRTPLLLLDVPEFPPHPGLQPGQGADGGVLLYGHLDKQPEMTGWDEGLGPWTPVVRDERLYGRGGADDGYATFAALAALSALQQNQLAHRRCIVLIEAGEESGSPDLQTYVDTLRERIGIPSLVVCLDSGCGNYDQLWCTTSLRGGVIGTLSVQILTEGVHSGDAGGIVPSSFRIARQLLSRIEDQASGRLLLPELHVEIPRQRYEQAVTYTKVLGSKIWDDFPWVAGARKESSEFDYLLQLALDRTWRPALAVTGVDGMPTIEHAGNVVRPLTALRLALRLPPTCDGTRAYQAVKQCLERDPPYGATVSFTADYASGWAAPELAPWLARSLDAASTTYFGREAVYSGDGGTIPFMSVLGKLFQDAQFLTTGVLGPQSNAHGPNEFLSLPTAKKLTCVLAQVLFDHHQTGVAKKDQAAGSGRRHGTAG